MTEPAIGCLHTNDGERDNATLGMARSERLL